MSDERPRPLAHVVGAANALMFLGHPVVATTPDGTIAIWNHAAEALYCELASNAAGHKVVDLFAPIAAGPGAAEILGAVADGTSWSGDFLVRGRDGVERRVRVEGSPVLDEHGAVMGGVTVSRDVTEEIRNEQSLLDSRDTLRVALAAGRLGTWKWDMATGSVRFDRQLEAIFGLPAGGFDGRFETYQALLHPDDLGYVLDVVLSAVAARTDYDVEHRCIWPDGSVHWLQGRGSVTLSSTGEVTGTVGCVGDMTERVLADTLPPLGRYTRVPLDRPTVVDLPEEWTLVMFTDGLFEGYASPGQSERMGVDRIEQRCAEMDGWPWDDHHLDELLAFVEQANGRPLGDDIGLLVLSSSVDPHGRADGHQVLGPDPVHGGLADPNASM